MKRISFDPRFVNEAGNDLIPGKIHTIRQNYEYWKKFEGREVGEIGGDNDSLYNQIENCNHDTEVIGNIHDNPELLEVKE
jgi:hypothetical protein